jgi:hypothetical protein
MDEKSCIPAIGLMFDPFKIQELTGITYCFCNRRECIAIPFHDSAMFTKSFQKTTYEKLGTGTQEKKSTQNILCLYILS